MKTMLWLFIAILLSPMCILGAPLAEKGAQPIGDAAVAYIEADTRYTDCLDAHIVVVPEDRLHTVNAYAKDLVDDGKILYIQDTTRSKEALADILSIPKATRSAYNDMPHMAAVLFKADDCYVFSYIYVQIAATDKPEGAEGIDALVPLEDGLASAWALYEAANNGPALVPGAE